MVAVGVSACFSAVRTRRLIVRNKHYIMIYRLNHKEYVHVMYCDCYIARMLIPNINRIPTSVLDSTCEIART